MKWKKAQYRGESSFGKKFLILLVILIIIYIILYYYDMIEIRQKTKNLFTSGKEKMNDVMGSDVGSTKNKFQPHTPEVDLSWCNAQNIPVDSSETSPESISIAGIDTVNQCCQKIFAGYNNCLNISSTFEICYDSNIGGTVKYARMNAKYVNPYYYQRFIKDIHKVYNPNFRKEVVCDLTIYGGIVK